MPLCTVLSLTKWPGKGLSTCNLQPLVPQEAERANRAHEITSAEEALAISSRHHHYRDHLNPHEVSMTPAPPRDSKGPSGPAVGTDPLAVRPGSALWVRWMSSRPGFQPRSKSSLLCFRGSCSIP